MLLHISSSFLNKTNSEPYITSRAFENFYMSLLKWKFR
ncbi:unnamed protein product [Haemonchus placei]|uniref:Uncharacterized protein n=1 Tax=Haemonchus placei TaxID=6290 RepID=A0A3P7S9E2_HAEPC|nr:unnamed protein product [Haemonchus placei]